MINEKSEISKLFDNAVKPGKCDVRLTEDEMLMLNKLAEDEDITKSDVMRKGLHELYKKSSKE